MQLWSWMVVFTEDGAVDVVEAVTRHQAVPACGTGETLEGEIRSAPVGPSLPGQTR